VNEYNRIIMFCAFKICVRVKFVKDNIAMLTVLWLFQVKNFS